MVRSKHKQQRNIAKKFFIDSTLKMTSEIIVKNILKKKKFVY